MYAFIQMSRKKEEEEEAEEEDLEFALIDRRVTPVKILYNDENRRAAQLPASLKL